MFYVFFLLILYRRSLIGFISLKLCFSLSTEPTFTSFFTVQGQRFLKLQIFTPNSFHPDSGSENVRAPPF